MSGNDEVEYDATEGNIPHPQPGGEKKWIGRPWITLGLLIAFGVEAAAALVMVFLTYGCGDQYQAHIEAMKDMMAIIFVPTVTLLGSVIGFYFGEKGGTG